MAEEKFAASLQQDLLTLLCWNDESGKTVAKTISANLFEGDYRVIAEKAIDFWKQYNTAPKEHIADLLSDIIDDLGDRRNQTYRRILVQMIEMKDKVNVEFVLRSMTSHIREAHARIMVLDVAEQLDARGAQALPDVEALMRGFLNETKVTLDPGLRLNEYDKVLEYLRNVQSEFDTGVRELDMGHIVPMRGKTWIIIAATGKGKTWGLTQLGKRAFLRRKKICHISLEIEAEEVLQRYYQALFGASKRDETNRISTFRFDRNHQLDQIVQQTVDVPFMFESAAVREELQTRINHFGVRANNLIVKRFPMRSLTPDQFEAYLEQLESIENFVPDMVIVDYVGIMKTDAKNHRISLGRTFEEMRGVAQRRNFAFVSAHQGNRDSVSAEFVKATHVSEDFSIMQSTDFAITYSQTPAESKLGLARLFVEKGRSEQDKFGVLITQTYKTGQFALESTRLSDAYARMMEHMGTADEEVSEDD